MSNQTSGGFVAPTSNPILEAISGLTSTVKDAAEAGIGVYSTFMSAKSAAALAKAQAKNGGVQTVVPDTSILNPVAQAEADAQAKTYFVYAVLGLVAVGGAVMVFRMAK